MATALGEVKKIKIWDEPFIMNTVDPDIENYNLHGVRLKAENLEILIDSEQVEHKSWVVVRYCPRRFNLPFIYTYIHGKRQRVDFDCNAWKVIDVIARKYLNITIRKGILL